MHPFQHPSFSLINLGASNAAIQYDLLNASSLHFLSYDSSNLMDYPHI